jgi:hypothetical protein
MASRPPTLDWAARAGSDTVALGGTPADGDFARLLEAASAPAAHRLGIDPSLADGMLLAPRRGLRRSGGPTGADGAPPRIRSLGSPSERAANGDAPGRAGPVPPPAALGRGTAPADATRPGAAVALPADAVPASPADRVGRAADPVRRAVAVWSSRPLRDRLVGLAFALVALWIVLTVVTAALAEPGDATGALIVIALSAFFVLRGLRRNRTPSRERP